MPGTVYRGDIPNARERESIGRRYMLAEARIASGTGSGFRVWCRVIGEFGDPTLRVAQVATSPKRTETNAAAGIPGAVLCKFIRFPRGRRRVDLLGGKLPSGTGMSTAILLAEGCHCRFCRISCQIRFYGEFGASREMRQVGKRGDFGCRFHPLPRSVSVVRIVI